MQFSWPLRIVCFGLICLIFPLTGCTSIEVNVPNPRIEPPEIRGDTGIIIETNISGGHSYEATIDGSNRPPDLTSPEVHKSVDVAPGVLWSPLEMFAFGLEVNPIALGGSAIVKLQLLGAGTRAAEPDDVPVGLYARAGYGSNSKEGDQSSTFGPGGYHWEGKAEASYLHLGASTGYRFTNHMMLYGGAAYGRYWVRTEITQDVHSSDPGGVYKSHDTGEGLTGGGGLMFNWTHFQFFVGADYSHIDYSDTPARGETYFRAGFAVNPR